MKSVGRDTESMCPNMKCRKSYLLSDSPTDDLGDFLSILPKSENKPTS